MKATIEWRRRRASRWLTFLSLVLIAIACSDEQSTTPAPDYAVGAFEGRVLSGGIPMEATVGARAATGTNRGKVLFLSRTNSEGHYALSVPSGTYWLEINPRGSGFGSIRFPGLGDTFTVADNVRLVDIECGSVRVNVRVPASMEGREVPAILDLPRDNLHSTAVVRGSQLQYSFSLLQAIKFSFGFGSPTSRSEYWLNGTFDPDSAKIFSLPVDREVVIDASLEGWASLAGSIVNACPARATVQAVSAVDSSIVGWTFTDAQEFLLDVLSARPVKIRVEVDGVERWIGGESFATAQVFDLQPGSVVSGLRLAGGGIRCELEGPGNVLSHRGTAVLYDELGRTHATSISSSSEDVIEFCDLAPGRYRLYISSINDDEIWGSQWFDGATSLAEATPIDVVDGEVTRVTAHLSEGAEITGRIVHEVGAPFEYGLVVLWDADRVHAAPYWVQPRDLGSFRFYGVGDGGYLAAVWTDDGPWWYPGTADPSEAERIEVSDHADVTGIDWTLP